MCASCGRVRVLIIEDAPDVAWRVLDALEETAQFELLGAVPDGDGALARIRAERPELVVLDLGLPGRPGLDVLRDLRDLAPDCRVVVHSGQDEPAVRAAALAAGAVAFVGKGDGVDALIDALLRAAHTGAA